MFGLVDALLLDKDDSPFLTLTKLSLIDHTNSKTRFLCSESFRSFSKLIFFPVGSFWISNDADAEWQITLHI